MVAKVKLGKMARDLVTGFEGIVDAKIQYANGCVQYKLLSSKLNEKNEEVALWFDKPRVVKMKKRKRKGGPFKGEPSFDKP
ncbi:MAG: hypothetical protein KAQ85_01655 [Thermodesulfovibrionia bacterium]|nr:hypothetical protein [Thermodesulfovibrionia bacterium]